MSTNEAGALISVSDYLASEKGAEVRHEYLNGVVFAMAGASRRHNCIALNLASALNSHLEGTPCQPYMGDLKVAIHRRSETLFYYPDTVVECAPAPHEDEYYTTEPKVIIEVLSPSTARIDRREKFWAYTEVETLQEYVLVDQDELDVTVYRRTDDWQPRPLSSPKDSLHLDSIEVDLTLEQIYAGIDFSSRP